MGRIGRQFTELRSSFASLPSLPAPTPRSVASVELLVALVLAMEVMEVMALGMEDMQLDMEATRLFPTTTTMLLLTATQGLDLIRRNRAMELELEKDITLSISQMAGSNTSDTTPTILRAMLLR